jgi:hypothetical protein
MSITRALAFFLIPASCLAADPVTMKIQVVDTAVTETSSNTGVSAYTGYSTTKCDTSGGYGNSPNSRGPANCTTKGVTGGAGHSVDKSTLHINVHAVLPDGTHTTLWCQTSLRHCTSLSPGAYVAEVKGNDAWVHITKLDGTDDKIKFRSTGGW